MNKTILFDLDGTLTLPARGVLNGIKYMAKKLKLNAPNKQQFKSFIGPPLQQTFRRFYGVDKNQSQYMVDVYREYYAKKGLFECDLVEGIEEVLATLKSQGKTLAVATCKPQAHAEMVLNHFNLTKYFKGIFGANLTENGSDKPSIIAKALIYLNAEKQYCVMIGDGEGDILGAKQSGIKSVGVLYGYGERRDLFFAGADKIVNTPQELLNILGEGIIKIGDWVTQSAAGYWQVIGFKPDYGKRIHTDESVVFSCKQAISNFVILKKAFTPKMKPNIDCGYDEIKNLKKVSDTELQAIQKYFVEHPEYLNRFKNAAEEFPYGEYGYAQEFFKFSSEDALKFEELLKTLPQKFTYGEYITLIKDYKKFRVNGVAQYWVTLMGYPWDVNENGEWLLSAHPFAKLN